VRSLGITRNRQYFLGRDEKQKKTISKIMMMTTRDQYGHGPWVAALIRDCKTQLSDIIVHTYPELVVAAINFKNQSQTQWEVLMCVGVFVRLDDCKRYGERWNRNRQLKTRVENGQKLFKKLCAETDDNYHLWQACSARPHPPPPSTLREIVPLVSEVSLGDVNELHLKRKSVIK
jgi:hypothetical protein